MRNPSRPELHAASFPQPSRLYAAALALASLTGAAAQSVTTGALHGTLAPSQSGTLLTLRSVESGQRFAVQVDRDRSFLLPALAPGDYVLAGPALPSSSIIIHTGETTEYPAAALLRDAAAPDAMPEVTPDQDDDGLVSTHGLPSTQNSLLIDGVSLTQSFHSTPVGTGSDPAPDSSADADSAEVAVGPSFGLSRGRRAGAVSAYSSLAIREFQPGGVAGSASASTAGTLSTIALTTRSGTSSFHGSASLAVRSQLFAATNPLSLATTYANGVSTTAPVKPHDLRQTFGATLGGPVPRTPLYFFYAFEAERRGFPAVSSPSNPSFYMLTAVQQALLRTRGVSSSATQAALNYLASLTGEVDRRSDQTLHFARVDWRAHAEAISLEYNRLRYNRPAGLTEAPVVAAARNSLGNANGNADALILRLTSTFTARRVNELRFQAARDLQYESAQMPLAQEPAISAGGLAPEVVIGPDGLRFGTPAGLSRQAYPDERRLDVSDTFSLGTGHHLIQFGGLFSAIYDRVATESNAAGTFRYDSTRTTANAGGLVDFITDQRFNVNSYPNGGCPSITAPVHLFCFTSFTQSFGVSRIAFPTEAYAGFVQDTWRPHPRVTLSAGLRYDYLLLPVPQQPNPALDLLFSSRGATSIFPEDRNNVGPHVSFAAEPFGAGRLLVQGSYSVFYGRLPGATVAAALSETALPSAKLKIRITPATVTSCPQTPANGFGYPCSFLATPTGVTATTTSAAVFDRHFRLPAVQQMTVRVSRALGARTELTAAYLLNLDRQLPSSTDLNIAPSTGQASFRLQGGPSAGLLFAVPLYTARVSPSFGPVTDIVSDGNATYNALVLTARTRLHRFMTADATYTFSKALDTGVALSGIPRTDNRFDPFTNGYDKSLSALNYPQTFRAVAELRSGESRHSPLRHWELAPVVLARSGRPYSYQIFGGSRLPGGHLSINGSGGALYLPTVGRDTLQLPAAVQVNLRLARSFATRIHLLGEPVGLRLGAEAFNVGNHVNLSAVEQRAYLTGTPANGVTPLVFQDANAIAAEGLNTRAFGTPTAAASSQQRERQLQFMVRLTF